MLRKELLNESMTHILLFQLFFTVHWDRRVSVLLNYQHLHSHVILCAVMLIWIAEMKCARGCVYVRTFACYVPRDLLCWATDANGFGWWRPAGRHWFNSNSMFCSTNWTMWDTNADALLKLVLQNLYSFKSTASSFNNNWYVKTIP